MSTPLEPTPKDVVVRDAAATLYRFRSSNDDAPADRGAVLLVPSLINRWYVLDLREGASVAASFVDAGFDTYCLDWGVPRDEDRYLTWEDVIARLRRMVARARRHSGADRIGILGYCMGATLSGIYTALHPDTVACFANLAGPFDFSHAGVLGEMVDPKWFDPEAITAAGNVAARQMQAGFVALRPTSEISKWVTLIDRGHDSEFRTKFRALDGWASDNIAFPAAAYRTYIEDLYQKNLLVAGEHRVAGRRVDLGDIDCPVLTIAASRDHICPEPAAVALNAQCGSDDTETIVIRGGHVGAVVGSRARKELYPEMTRWFGEKLARSSVTNQTGVRT